MEILFIRHGESLNNRDKHSKDTSRYHDIGLTKLGKCQCYSCPQIKSEDADIIFTSPLTRALKTTNILCKYVKKRVVVLPEISEFEEVCNYGDIKSLSNSFDNDVLTDKKYKDFNWGMVNKLGIFRNSHDGVDNKKIQLLLVQFLKSFLDNMPLKYKKIIIICHAKYINLFLKTYSKNHDSNKWIKNTEHIYTKYDGITFNIVNRVIYKLRKFRNIKDDPIKLIDNDIYNNTKKICYKNI